MRRYATAPLSTFEELFTRARSGLRHLGAHEYPPVCAQPSGELSLALGRTGALIVHVDPGACASEEFRVRLLFETGACVFSSPADLAAFCTGPLAAAFQIVSSVPTGSPPAAVPTKPTGTVADGKGATTAQTAAADLVEDLLPAGGRTPRPTEPGPSDLTVSNLVERLGRTIHGQDAALERVASVAVAHLKKRQPARPGSVLLIGPTGAGKTATVEALPAALGTLGVKQASVFRVDCGELSDSIQLTRLLGSPPGFSGHRASTPLVDALRKPGCILLVDEIEKAHSEILDLLLGLLDAGRLSTPHGEAVDARKAIVALTTSAGAGDLTDRLAQTPLEDRWTVQRICSEHLARAGLSTDLLGRIGAFAAYADVSVPDDDDARERLAHAAIVALGQEYGLAVSEIDPVVAEVVQDVADHRGSAGARAYDHAAREILAEALAAMAEDGPRRLVMIEAGPPIAVRRLGSVRRPV